MVPRQNPRGQIRLLAALVGFSLLLVAGSLLIAVHQGGMDDAFISYRYARNLADGYGLVFNRGELPVEGYSNLLYTLALAPAFRAGLDGIAIYYLSVGLNLLASLGVLVLLACYLRRRFGEGAALAGSALFAVFPAIWFWNASGLETMWVLLLQVGAWVAVDRLVEDREGRLLPWAVVACVLLVLVRADGFVLPVFLTLYLCLRRQWRPARVLALATVVTTLGVMLWQFHCYGQPVPNTAYVKVSGAPLARLQNALATAVRCRHLWLYWLALALAAGSAVSLALRTRNFGKVPAGIFLAAGLSVYFLYIGGDFFGERFLLLHVPVAICSLFGLGVLSVGTWRVASVWAILALLAYQLAIPWKGDARLADMLFARIDNNPTPAWVQLGQFLHRAEPGRTLAVDAAGAVPFFSQLRTVDMLGLSDTYIAHLKPNPMSEPGHSKYDPGYVIARDPDLIAAWAVSEGCDLAYGLHQGWWRDRYAVKYLLYTGVGSPPPGSPAILDTECLSREEIALAFRRGYLYAVIKRADLLSHR